jgi:hypothetical protein
MAGSFSLDLRKFTEHTKSNADLAVRGLILRVGRGIDEKSPVGDASYWVKPPPPGYAGGRFRANWQYSEGAPSTSYTSDVDPSGGATLAKLAAGIVPNPAGKVHYYVNNLPYARRIENGWSHRQAPQGVVKITVAEFQQYVNEVTGGLP